MQHIGIFKNAYVFPEHIPFPSPQPHPLLLFPTMPPSEPAQRLQILVATVNPLIDFFLDRDPPLAAALDAALARLRFSLYFLHAGYHDPAYNRGALLHMARENMCLLRLASRNAYSRYLVLSSDYP